MRRGELWWADLPDAGRRPVLVLTRDALLPGLTNVTVAFVTKTRRGIDTKVELTPAEHGVLKPCFVRCDNLNTVPKGALDAFIVALDLPW